MNYYERAKISILAGRIAFNLNQHKDNPQKLAEKLAMLKAKNPETFDAEYESVTTRNR